MTKNYPRVPHQHVQVLRHAVGRDGAHKVAGKIGVAPSVVYRIIEGTQTSVRASTLAKIGSFVNSESGRAETTEGAADFRAAVRAIVKILRPLSPKDRREALEFCLDNTYDKADE